MRYFWNEQGCPQVSTANYLSANDAEIPFEEAELRDMKTMWEGASLLGATFPELVPDPQYFTDTVQLRLEDMNQHITWLLSKDPEKRPSIEHVCLHIGANAIRKSLELGRLVLPFIQV